MYDSEQKLKRHIYYDDEHGIVGEFIYNEFDGQFIWITLTKIY